MPQSPPRPGSRPFVSKDSARRQLVAVGKVAGLDAVGFASARPFVTARTAIERNRSDGYADQIEFTYRNPKRSTTPQQSLPGARSMVVGALGHPSTSALPSNGGPVGRVAAYATHDHYRLLRSALEEVAAVLTAQGFRTLVLADDNALVDRFAAVRAGIGCFGRSSNVLIPHVGPGAVLGAVLTTAELALDRELLSSRRRVEIETAPELDWAPSCKTCSRCLDSCPTQAIVASGVVDARRCLAWLLQRPGVFPRRWRLAAGTRIYGCDDCSDACPPSRHAAQTADLSVDLHDLLQASDGELNSRYSHWWVPDLDMDHVRRNALLALGNSGCRGDTSAALLTRYISHPNAVLRGQALWSARRLGMDWIGAKLAGDSDPIVLDEWNARVPSPAGGLAGTEVR